MAVFCNGRLFRLTRKWERLAEELDVVGDIVYLEYLAIILQRF